MSDIPEPARKIRKLMGLAVLLAVIALALGLAATQFAPKMNDDAAQQDLRDSDSRSQ